MVAGDVVLETTAKPDTVADKVRTEVSPHLSSRNGVTSFNRDTNKSDYDPLKAKDTLLASNLTLVDSKEMAANEIGTAKGAHDRTISLRDSSVPLTLTANLSGRVPNYVQQATIHLMRVGGKHLEGGAEQIKEHVGKILNWNEQHKKEGFQGASHKDIGDALYLIAHAYEVKRAVNVSQTRFNRAMGETLAFLSDPDRMNKQGFLPSCTANSVAQIEARLSLRAVADQMTSAFTRGRYDGISRTATFTSDELNRDFTGVNIPSHILAAVPYKFTYGHNFQLNTDSGGLRYDQAANAYYQSTGKQLPFKRHLAQSGMRMRMYHVSGALYHSVVDEIKNGRVIEHNSAAYT